MTSVWGHSRYFSRLCNFAIFEGISSEFGKVVYFDMFIKFPAFPKYCFISLYFIAENVFDTNDVRMTSLEGTHFIFSYEN